LRKLARAADCLGLFPRGLRRRLLVEAPALHLAKHALPLHLLLQDPERLIDIVIANEYLQCVFLPFA
jgi:hypothetical protein